MCQDGSLCLFVVRVTRPPGGELGVSEHLPAMVGAEQRCAMIRLSGIGLFEIKGTSDAENPSTIINGLPYDGLHICYEKEKKRTKFWPPLH